MKRSIAKKKPMLILAIALVTAVFLTIAVIANSKTNVMKKYQGKSDEYIVASLEKLGKEELITEVNSVFEEISESNINAAIPFASELLNRVMLNEFSEDEIVELITDSKNNEFFRITFVQLYSGYAFESRTSKGNNSIRELLSDEKTGVPLKENIIIGLDFSDERGLELLNSIANGKDGVLAFQAIKKLNTVDSSTATDLSRTILKDYQNGDEDKVCAAIKVMAEEYRIHRIRGTLTEELQKEKLDFIKICNYFIDKTESKEDMVGTTAIFALSDMTDSDAISALITNQNVEEFYKGYAIEQNCLTFIDMAKNSPSAEEIDVICEAMSIRPLNDLAKVLSELKSEAASKNINGAVEKLDKAINTIRSEGVSSDPKWNSLYNKE